MSGQLVSFPLERARAVSVEHDVTKQQLARLWGRSQRWIEMQMRDGGLPYFKDARSRFVVFPLADCERWRAERMRRSA